MKLILTMIIAFTASYFGTNLYINYENKNYYADFKKKYQEEKNKEWDKAKTTIIAECSKKIESPNHLSGTQIVGELYYNFTCNDKYEFSFIFQNNQITNIWQEVGKNKEKEFVHNDQDNKTYLKLLSLWKKSPDYAVFVHNKMMMDGYKSRFKDDQMVQNAYELAQGTMVLIKDETYFKTSNPDKFRRYKHLTERKMSSNVSPNYYITNIRKTIKKNEESSQYCDIYGYNRSPSSK